MTSHPPSDRTAPPAFASRVSCLALSRSAAPEDHSTGSGVSLGRFPKSGDELRVSIALPAYGLFPRTGEATREIRNQSKTGPVVPPLAELTATLSHQIDEMKQR